MSYFIFGELIFPEKLEICLFEDLSWKIQRCANSKGLFVLFEKNICQSVVFQMLDEQTKPSGNRLRFMLSNSPLCDTSDSLISQYYYGATWERELKLRLSCVQEFLICLISEMKVSTVNIFISEGYSPDFEGIDFEASKFLEVISKRVAGNEESPIKVAIHG